MPQNLTQIINTMTVVVGAATPFALVLLFFFWNMAQLILTSGDAEKAKQARARIAWGVIAIAVLFTLGGIVAVLTNTFFGTGIGAPTQQEPPKLPPNTFQT